MAEFQDRQEDATALRSNSLLGRLLRTNAVSPELET